MFLAYFKKTISESFTIPLVNKHLLLINNDSTNVLMKNGTQILARIPAYSQLELKDILRSAIYSDVRDFTKNSGIQLSFDTENTLDNNIDFEIYNYGV